MFTSAAEHLRFLQMFLLAPRTVGAIAPSSPALAAQIVRAAGVGRAERIVELGGGTGSFTRSIVEEAAETASILSIEVNPTFAEILAERFTRVHVIADSAEHLREHMRGVGMSDADCVVSGLPWSVFSSDLQLRLLRAVHGALRSGGTFTTFAYLHAAWLPAAREFREHLASHFASVKQSPVVWQNLPPAFIYQCRKQDVTTATVHDTHRRGLNSSL
jgi:phospholipid N-methyltransferase